MEKIKTEGKLIVDYVHRQTKLEEFVVNFSNVSNYLSDSQSMLPNTVKKFIAFSDGLTVNTEEEAANALHQLEEFVCFSKKDIELLERLRSNKLERRIDNILPSYDLRGRVGLLKKEVLKEQYWKEKERLVLIESGFGAEPNKIGRAIYVTFLSDLEEARYNRDSLECIFCDDVNSLLTED